MKALFEEGAAADREGWRQQETAGPMVSGHLAGQRSSGDRLGKGRLTEPEPSAPTERGHSRTLDGHVEVRGLVFPNFLRVPGLRQPLYFY